MVGDASKLVLPDVGRMRGGAGRFRGLRLVHTHLRGEPLTRDDLTDLALLRLDLVAAITRRRRRARRQAARRPPAARRSRRELPWRELPRSRRRRTTDFLELITRARGRVRRARTASASTDVGKDRALLVHVAARPRRATPRRASPSCSELCRTAGRQRARRARPAPPRGRSAVPRRTRQARGDPAARDAARRRGRDLRSRSHARVRRARSATPPSSRSSTARC